MALERSRPARVVFVWCAFRKGSTVWGLLSRLYGVVRIAEKDPQTSHMRA